MVPKIKACRGCDAAAVRDGYCDRCWQETKGAVPIQAYDESIYGFAVICIAVATIIAAAAFLVPTLPA